MKTLVGVDIGTQGTKVALFDESGKCLATAFRASKPHRPAPGALEEDPEVQYDSVCRTTKECLAKSGVDPASVAGIAIDGQMAGIIGVGTDGRHVTPYDSWLDTRCAPYIRMMEAQAGDEIAEKTGCPPSFNHGPKILWWKHEHKDVFDTIAAFVQPGGYAAMRLCGLDGAAAFIDSTYLHFSGFADNRRGVWDEDLCRRFHLDPAKLPAIMDPQSIVGEVSAEAARKCGLRRGTPMVAGCGDTAASFLACGATAEGISVDVAGTASVFATTTSRFLPDTAHRMLGCGRSATPGLWHPYAYINGGGMNLEWFRHQIANRGNGNGRGRGIVDFDQLNRLAARVSPRPDDPLFIPHLGGRVCPSEPDLRGAWIGLCWDHGLGHLYRAVLEGVALEYAIYRKVLLEMFPDLRLKELRITGGGEKSDVWNTIKADALQTPVRRVTRSEGAPLGAALLAGFGVGLYRSLPAAAKRWIALADTVRPTRAMAAHYAARQAHYEALLQSVNASFNTQQ